MTGGGDLPFDVEKEIESLPRYGDMRLFIPCHWTVETLTIGLVIASLLRGEAKYSCTGVGAM